MPTRVLHVVDHTRAHKTSGYSVRSGYIFDTQVRQGIEPYVMAIQPLTQRASGKSNGGSPEGVVLFYPDGPRFRFPTLPLFVSGWKKNILEIVQEREIDVIHAHSPFFCGLPSLAAARAARIPFVFEVRGLWHESVRANQDTRNTQVGYWLRDNLERKCCRNADAVVTISDGLRKHLKRKYGLKGDIELVPNGVEYERFAAPPRTARPPELPDDGSVVLGYIGTLRNFEGLDLPIRAMARAGELSQRVRIVIGGWGPERPALEALVEELGVGDRVTFLGTIPHERVMEFYDHIDVMLFPRHRWTVTEIVTPLKPLEALAAGKLLLASDVGGLAELVHNPRFVFRAGDVDDFLTKLNAIVSDMDAAHADTAAGREFAQSRDWSRVCEGYAGLYQRLAEQD